MDIRIEFETEEKRDGYIEAIRFWDGPIGNSSIMADPAEKRFSVEFTGLTETQANWVRGFSDQYEGKEIFPGSSDVSIEFKKRETRTLMARRIEQEHPDIDGKVEKSSIRNQFIVARGLTDRQFDLLTEKANEQEYCGTIRVLRQTRAFLPLHAAENI